jgi:hypothetical protein
VACGNTIQIPDFAPADVVRQTRRLSSLGPTGRWLIAGLIALFITGVLISLIRVGGAAAVQAQAASTRGRCLANLQKIAAALNAYANDHGAYPLPYIADSAGKPLLSWRVTLLPYLGHQDLYNAIRLDQAWDSPENSEMMFRCPDVYESPADDSNSGDTSYMLITGTGTLFPGNAPLAPQDIGDGPAKTLLVVETAPATSGQATWTKPVDLNIGRMTMVVGGAPGIEIGGNHQGGATVVTADGRAHFLRDTTSAALLRALISPNGGEAVRDDALD